MYVNDAPRDKEMLYEAELKPLIDIKRVKLDFPEEEVKLTLETLHIQLTVSMKSYQKFQITVHN